MGDPRTYPLRVDEPSGKLDKKIGQQVLRLLLELRRDAGKSLVRAAQTSPLAEQVCRILEGKLMVTAHHPVKELIL
jgi:predicted ABC-type transport system involved in lysophospholipase L1 biosynthesis ATPase subunit